jgi:hypothetical protein
MLAMDIPMSTMCGLILAEAGRDLVETRDPFKLAFMRVVVLLFAAVAMAPNVFYYMLGWPAWEVNFMWSWVDTIQDHPLRAAFSHALFAATLLPALLGFEIGRQLIYRKRYRLVRISYIVLLLVVGLIDLVLWDITFNIASTYAKYQAGQFYSFWTPAFATGWAITSIYFWVVLAAFYVWLRRLR